jgi:hypothetical protein
MSTEQNQVNGEEEIYAEAGGKRRAFLAAPAGQHQAVLVDVRDAGMKEVKFEGVSKGMKPHVIFIWQINERINLEIEPTDDDDTKKYKQSVNGGLYTASQMYVNTLGGKAKLKKHIESILGRTLSDKECGNRGFGLSTLVGQNCTLTIVHSEKEGTVYANVRDVTGWNVKFGALMQPENYVRFKDRPKGADGKPLYGEALEKHNLKLKFEALLEEGQEFGITLKGGPIDLDKLSVDDLKASVSQWEASVEAARVKVGATAGATGSDPFADEGEATDEEVDSMLNGTPKASKPPRTMPEAIKEVHAAAAKPKEGESDFDQDWFDIANNQWTGAGNPALGEHIRPVLEAAKEAEFPVGESRNIVTDTAFVGAINDFLKSVGRTPIEDLSKLKTAQAALVTSKINSADITM